MGVYRSFDGYEDDDEDMDIDVCQNCGRYFVWTPRLKELWQKHWKPGETERQPQRCERCIVNDAWCEEEP